MTLTQQERIRAAEQAVEDLRAGFKEVGVSLPSLRVDPVSCANAEPLPLVELGRCNLDTALRLAAVLQQARS
ncbi:MULTISPECIES: hypothetical protein [unclassified Streptomyces]|uniref:hypothetical protein n=1 Tax=unclassified Streptomyces TaxID=2593676 RepID=UPI002E1CAB38|nr:hypothetical protein OG217_21190 [Streptomyces sp. NBC_01023]